MQETESKQIKKPTDQELEAEMLRLLKQFIKENSRWNHLCEDRGIPGKRKIFYHWKYCEINDDLRGLFNARLVSDNLQEIQTWMLEVLGEKRGDDEDTGLTTCGTFLNHTDFPSFDEVDFPSEDLFNEATVHGLVIENWYDAIHFARSFWSWIDGSDEDSSE